MFSKIKNAMRPKINVEVKHTYQSNFLNKVAVVFGGTSGIGLAIAKTLHLNGAKTIICGKSDDPKIDGITFYYFDLLDISNIKTVLDDIISKNARIDILINSQGICPIKDFQQDFFAISPDDYDNVFAINSKSIFFSCQYICKYFINNSIKGRILNIVSTESLKGGVVPYALSKASLLSFTRGLGKMMAKKGIVVNGISPGATATKMMGFSGDLAKSYIPSGRMCVPEEIAQLAIFMLSDEGCQMPGQVVVLDGGESL